MMKFTFSEPQKTKNFWGDIGWKLNHQTDCEVEYWDTDNVTTLLGSISAEDRCAIPVHLQTTARAPPRRLDRSTPDLTHIDHTRQVITIRRGLR